MLISTGSCLKSPDLPRFARPTLLSLREHLCWGLLLTESTPGEAQKPGIKHQPPYGGCCSSPHLHFRQSQPPRFWRIRWGKSIKDHDPSVVRAKALASYFSPLDTHYLAITRFYRPSCIARPFHFRALFRLHHASPLPSVNNEIPPLSFFNLMSLGGGSISGSWAHPIRVNNFLDQSRSHPLGSRLASIAAAVANCMGWRT